MKKQILTFSIGLLITLGGFGQQLEFIVQYSEPLAVFEYVQRLSNQYPDNTFKDIFNNSKFNKEKYQNIIIEFDSLIIDYTFEFQEYPYAQKIGGSTESMLKKNLINSQTIDEFRLKSFGLIPNSNLKNLAEILKHFEPIYQELIYEPNKDKFEKQIQQISKLVDSTNISKFFQQAQVFYNSTWDDEIPFKITFYPLPNSKGFTATAYYNNAVSAIPEHLDDYNILLSVQLHEIFHILYDEQPLEIKKQIENWFAASPSLASRYAFLLLNEALATSLGNGYVYGKLNGELDDGPWYNRKYTNLLAKEIYSLVHEYVSGSKSIDKQFVDKYIDIYESKFSHWMSELDNLMTDRYVISANKIDFNTVDQLFPYRSMSAYEDNITTISIEKMTNSPISKLVIISQDHDLKLKLLRQNFEELSEWNPNADEDFSYAKFLNDKTYLIVINSVKKSIKELLEEIKAAGIKTSHNKK